MGVPVGVYFMQDETKPLEFQSCPQERFLEYQAAVGFRVSFDWLARSVRIFLSNPFGNFFEF
jgi:hypothetical protein